MGDVTQAAGEQPVAPINITVAHPEHVSAADVLNIVNSVVDADAPLVLQSIPSTSPKVSAAITFGEIGLGVINQIAQLVHSHAKKTAPMIAVILGLLCIALAPPNAMADGLTFHPVPLGPEQVGLDVLYAYHAEGGIPPYTWRLSAGMLPPGLLLTPAGLLNGTLASPGIATYGLTVMDAAGDSASGMATFDVRPVPLPQRVGRFAFTGRSGLLFAEGALVLAQLFDYQTTEKCVRLPGGVCREGNAALLAAGIDPATSQGSRRFLVLKTVGPALTVGLQQLIVRKLRFSDSQLRAVIIADWAGAAVQGGVDYHNHTLTQRLQAAEASGP